MTAMNRHTTLLTLTLSFAAASCAAAPTEEAALSAAASQALSLEDCATQRDACFAENPILGLLTCPAQFTQCTAAVASGIPREVAAAVDDARECVRVGVACVAEAGADPVALAVCAENEAQCVAAIVDIDLPNVVEGTAACVDGAVDCIESAESRDSLVACGVALGDCALDQVKEVVPPEVAETIDDVVGCTNALRGCVADTASAAGITGCSERQAQCVANSLDVDLPDVPLSEVVGCAESAAQCTLGSEDLASVAACADKLRQCAVDIIAEVDVPEALTCEQKWTVCVGNDQLRIFTCAAELSDCRD
ncbi:MAG TPA: hypothetical protein VMF89_06125 [Polyangiales bacterium]|nr:hypothetical protein [Polyangiales bacterium]